MKSESKNLRFLVLVSDAYGGIGGIAKFNRDLISSLCSYEKCSEVVAVPRVMPNQSEEQPQKLKYIISAVNNKLSFVFSVFKIVFNNPKFDFIICGHINLLPFAYLISRFLIRCPLILIVHGVEVWQSTTKPLSNQLLKRVDFCISVSDVTKRRMTSWSGVSSEKVFILHNCVDLKSFSPGSKNLEWLKKYNLTGKKVLMTTGRLVSHERYKGFDEVLEVLPELKKEIPDLAYLILGDGTDKKRLQEKARDLHLTDCVVFAGFVPEKEKRDHYRLADVYVMPSSGEGFGIVFLEAMACGIPVIGSKIDGSREALQEGKLGVLVNPANPEEIKKAIIESLAFPKKIPKGLEYFSLTMFEQRVHDFIDDFLNKRKQISQ